MRNTISCILMMILSSPALAGTVDDPVVGGHAAAPGEWPDVALVVAPTALCSGTLIAPDVVLTAGHCIATHPVEVIVGTVDYSMPGGERIAIASATAYPDWQHAYDVGVLVLAHPAMAKPRAIAAACTVRDHLSDGAQVHLVGFGLTAASGTGNNTKLNEAMLEITDATCTEAPACNAAIAPGGEFAAGGGGTDSCFGDSGGPLYLESALVGVVSRGTGTTSAPCGGGGVYVRADKVVKWIEQTTHRTVTRASCNGKADGEGDTSDDSAGGCSAGGGIAGGALLLLAALWILTIPRRKEAKLR